MPSSTDKQPQVGAAAMEEAEQHTTLTASLSGTKRKEPERKKPSFKVVGHLVLAMKRFSASLNPTYTYGKRPTSSSGGGSKLSSEDTEAVTSSGEKRLDRPPSIGRSASPRVGGADVPDHQKYAYSTHGHKFDFLLKPLPPTEDEEAAAAPPAAVAAVR